MNQYTTTSFDTRQHDLNGNLSRINPGQPGAAMFTYDYRNQLVMVSNLSVGMVVRYTYDALGRRIAKLASGMTADRYVYHLWQEIEEQNGANLTLASYVYGLYLDEILAMRREGADAYFHADQLHTVMAVSDAAGAVMERYFYDDFGHPRFFDGTGVTNPGSVVGNPLLFTGRRFETEIGLFCYRTRMLDPGAGRFITRDTIGTWGDAHNLGNAYAYVGNNPARFNDPHGRGVCEDAKKAGLDKGDAGA